MIGSTKILTVSYGTFSCTLEGFDDPFGTMRQIAEYFRDLAAEDRYFGAEPPTPDVEMLQNIAEREARRRVEARMSETGVALQVAAEPSAAAEPEATVPPKPESRPVSKPVTRPVSEARPVAPESGPLTYDDDFLMADEPDDVLAVDPLAKPPADGPAETVAEKLRRIRAVVSRSIEPQEDAGSFSQPQALSADETGEAKRDRAQTRTIRQISEDLADDEDALSAQPRTGELPEETPAEPAEENAEAAQAEARASQEYPEAEATFDTEPDMIFAEEREEAVAETADVGEEGAAEATAPTGWDWSEEPEVIAFDEEPEADTAETAREDDTADDESVKNSISAVLGRLSAAAGEQAEKTSEILRLDSPVSTPVSQRRTSRPLGTISDADSDVGRLMAETDSKLNEDDTVRRRRVISQMRAAVAATKADRLMSRRVASKEAEDEAEQSPYRHDLSEAVRDVSTPLPSERAPISRKSAAPPLVLVSSQRVDAPQSVRPSMAPKAVPERIEAGGFASFAEDMGAKDLTELLEAAAAYTSFVEGQSSFTRPEIMKRVARVDPTIRLSREESLRSFGQLLRQGKFRKLERGQFTIAKDTRFHPNQRIAGE